MARLMRLEAYDDINMFLSPICWPDDRTVETPAAIPCPRRFRSITGSQIFPQLRQRQPACTDLVTRIPGHPVSVRPTRSTSHMKGAVPQPALFMMVRRSLPYTMGKEGREGAQDRGNSKLERISIVFPQPVSPHRSRELVSKLPRRHARRARGVTREGGIRETVC